MSDLANRSHAVMLRSILDGNTSKARCTSSKSTCRNRRKRLFPTIAAHEKRARNGSRSAACTNRRFARRCLPGALLAGWEQTKALLPWRGSTLVRYLAGELGFFSELLHAAAVALLPGADWRLVRTCGPAAGHWAHSRRAERDALGCALCVACDLRFLRGSWGGRCSARSGGGRLPHLPGRNRARASGLRHLSEANFACRDRAAAGGRFSHDAPARESEDRLFSGHSRADAEREYAGNLERNYRKRPCLMQVRPLRCSAGAGFLRVFVDEAFFPC